MRSKRFVITLITGMLTMCGQVRAEVAVGEDAPTWKMIGSDGQTYSSDGFKGKKAYVIAWYPKAFTGG
ncbi:MAG: hypothetical protein P1U77_11300 [Rubripirellula sp.]|nr:hypothetical protein [Rubripirellula sp.]